jgi:hypothetical protein
MRALLLALATGYVLIGCGGDKPTGPKASGTFTASFTGTKSGTGAGAAIFGSQFDDQLRLTGTDDIKQILIVNGGGYRLRLTPGVHSVNNDSRTDAYSFLELSDGTAFEATGGTVTITTSTRSALIGTFEITYETNDLSHSVTVSGSFEAHCVKGSQESCN